MPLDAAIGKVFTPYCPGGCHGHQYWHTQLSCGVRKFFSEASILKAQKMPLSQLIEATSCAGFSNSIGGVSKHCVAGHWQMLWQVGVIVNHLQH